MKFAQITITNFLAIGEATIGLADRGLVLLQGVNEDDTSADSNGAGKSSIADALCFVLFGTTARGEEGDKVINRTAGKNCSVTVTIDDDGTSYTITRYRKHKTGKNSLTVQQDAGGMGVVDLTKGTDKLTQAVVQQIIGCSYEVFRSSIYAGQESFPDLPNMTDKQLKLLVEEASGVTILEKAYEEARTRHAKVKEKADRLAQERARLAQRADDMEESVRAAETRKAEFEAERSSSAADQTLALKGHIEAAKALDPAIAAGDEPGLRAKMAACDAAIAAVNGEIAEERRLADALTGAERDVVRLRSFLGAHKATFEKQKQAVADIEHQVGCPCHDCGRPLTADEIAPARDARKKALGETLATFNATRAEAEKAIAAHKASAESVSKFRASMTDVSETSAQRASHERELMAVLQLQRQRADFAAKAREAGERIKAIRARPNPYEAEIEKLRGQIDSHVTMICELDGNAEAVTAELRVAEIAVQVFSPAGVRAHILDTVTPFLNDQTAKYLSILSDDNIEATWTTLIKTAKGELREKFSIEVVSKSGGERFASVSGGEKRKVRIAAALALQDLVSTRASKPIELWVGDEVDDALDNAGLERLMTILETKARERGSVFVVSHRDLKSWIPQVLTVTKSGGLATVKEEFV